MGYYCSLSPLGLPGAVHLRLPEYQAKTYRVLTRYLQAETDRFVTLPGLNSLYFWCGATPPTYFNVAESVLLNREQQAQVLAALHRSAKSVVVTKGAIPTFAFSGGVLERVLSDPRREVAKVGEFRILKAGDDQLGLNQ